MSKLLLAVIALVSLIGVNSHGTEVAKCVTAVGALRIYVRHWHSTGESPGTMNIRNNANGVTTKNIAPKGYVGNKYLHELPDCATAIQVVTTCPGQNQKNWVYYEYTLDNCNAAIDVTLLSGNTVVLMEGCSQLYPATIKEVLCANICATDTTAPSLQVNGAVCSSGTTVNVNNVCGSQPVTWATTVKDLCDPAAKGSISHSSGSTFAVGCTQVTMGASDVSGNSASCTFNVCVNEKAAGGCATPSPTAAPTPAPTPSPTPSPTPAPVDCVGAFIDIVACSKACNTGIKTIQYKISTFSAHGGASCPHANGYTTTAQCNTVKCVTCAANFYGEVLTQAECSSCPTSRPESPEGSFSVQACMCPAKFDSCTAAKTWCDGLSAQKSFGCDGSKRGGYFCHSTPSSGKCAGAVPLNPCAQKSIDLGSVRKFCVLSYAAITSTGLTDINCDIGTSPGVSITGIPDDGSILTNGAVKHINDAASFAAYSDLVVAFADAASRTTAASCYNNRNLGTGGLGVAGTWDLGTGVDVGGLTLFPGLYKGASSIHITGDLTLDAQNDDSAVFIFQIGSTLVTAAKAKVVLKGGAKASNIFWQLGSSGTMGEDSVLEGTVLAYAAFTTTRDAVVHGRILAKTEAVTFIKTHITLPVAV